MTHPPHAIINVASFGYALFLSISVTSIWGGVFPYFADEWRTIDMTVSFYIAQIAATAATFAAILAASWFKPKAAEKVFALGFSIPLAAGPLLLLASMYLSKFTPALVIAGAVLTGVGSAGFLASWQRVFASMEAPRGTSALIAGTTGSALIYFCICFIPAALVAYLCEAGNPQKARASFDNRKDGQLAKPARETTRPSHSRRREDAPPKQTAGVPPCRTDERRAAKPIRQPGGQQPIGASASPSNRAS